jgi:hypothetical protein
LIDYFGPNSSCPSSPTLPNKNLLSRPTASTLSPPGVPLASSSTSIASSGKRRGLGLSNINRASHKRAHIGRDVRTMREFCFCNIIEMIFYSSLSIIHLMNYLLNCKN